MTPGQDNGAVKVIDTGTFLEGTKTSFIYFKTGITLLEQFVYGLPYNRDKKKKKNRNRTA